MDLPAHLAHPQPAYRHMQHARTSAAHDQLASNEIIIKPNMLQMTRLHALNSNAESEIPDGAESSVHVRDVFEWDPTTAAFAPIPAEERTTQVPLPHPPYPQLTPPGPQTASEDSKVPYHPPDSARGDGAGVN